MLRLYWLTEKCKTTNIGKPYFSLFKRYQDGSYQWENYHTTTKRVRVSCNLFSHFLVIKDDKRENSVNFSQEFYQNTLRYYNWRPKDHKGMHNDKSILFKFDILTAKSPCNRGQTSNVLLYLDSVSPFIQCLGNLGDTALAEW